MRFLISIFQGYDSHFILSSLVEIRKQREIYLKVLPYNEEQYRAIYVNNFAFLDTYQFLFQSLDALMKDYVQRKEVDEMKIINQSRLALKDEKFSTLRRNFLLRKGLVPWGLISGRKVLREKRDKLPEDLKDYYSNLSNSTPTEEELQRAQEFYKEFNCQSLLDYLRIYCETDVIILAEIFSDMRNDIWEWACVDIAHFVGLPAAAFCVFKKMSGCKVGLIEDPGILNTVLSGIRGGMRYFFLKITYLK